MEEGARLQQIIYTQVRLEQEAGKRTRGTTTVRYSEAEERGAASERTY